MHFPGISECHVQCFPIQTQQPVQGSSAFASYYFLLKLALSVASIILYFMSILLIKLFLFIHIENIKLIKYPFAAIN